MHAYPPDANKLEQQYFREAEKLKRKLLKGKQWKKVQKERDTMTRLAIAICENHHKPYTREKLFFGEMNV